MKQVPYKHRLACGFCVPDGEEAHQYVRKTRGSKHQRQAEGNGFDRICFCPDWHHGLHDLQVLRMGGNRVGEELVEAPAFMRHDPERHQCGAPKEQSGLDDLHPGRGFHATESHVDYDQSANDDDGNPIGDLRNKRVQQLSRPHRLPNEVPDDDNERTDGGHRADRSLLKAEGGHVGIGELAEVAQPLRDKEQDDWPADQPTHRIDEAVETVEVNQSGDTEKRSRRHVVAGNRHPVLQPSDAASGGVKVGRRLRPHSRPIGDTKSNGYENNEHHDGVPIDGWRRRRRSRGCHVGRVRHLYGE